MRNTRIVPNAANKIVYPELSYKLAGVSFRIQNELGRFCTEKQYANVLEEELKRLKVSYAREKYSPTLMNNKAVGRNWVDFVIEDKIAVDLKARPYVERADYY